MSWVYGEKPRIYAAKLWCVLDSHEAEALDSGFARLHALGRNIAQHYSCECDVFVNQSARRRAPDAGACFLEESKACVHPLALIALVYTLTFAA